MGTVFVLLTFTSGGNVVGVHETEQRRHCLDLGERHGIDVLSVTKLVVESVSNTSWDDGGSADFITAETQLNVATTDVSVSTDCMCN